MNVLISAAGRRVRVVQFFREALADLGMEGRVYACDMNGFSPAIYAADEYFLVPAASDKSFIPQILRACEDRKIGLVVSFNDHELIPYAESRQAFEERGIQVAISSAETVRLARDKRACHDWLAGRGFPVPRRWPAEAIRGRSDLTFPVVVKPAHGSAGIGVVLARSAIELTTAVEDTPSPIVEELQVGKEFTVNVLASRDGRVVCAVPHLRLEIRAGEVAKGRTFRHAGLLEMAERLLQALPGCRGPLNFQGFLTPSGEIRLTEINPRFGGGYPLAHAAGARFPEWLLAEASGQDIPLGFSGWESDIAIMRYDQELVGRFVSPDRMEPL